MKESSRQICQKMEVGSSLAAGRHRKKWSEVIKTYLDGKPANS